MTISCEAETGVGIELKLVFGSILWLRWKSCVACGWSLVLLCGSRICSSLLLQSCFFKWLYQRFLTSLSVRPGRAAILSQLQHNTNWSNYHIIWLWKSCDIWIGISALTFKDPLVFFFGGPSRCLLLWPYHHGFPCKNGRN